MLNYDTIQKKSGGGGGGLGIVFTDGCKLCFTCSLPVLLSDEKIDGESFLDLKESDLKDMGFAKGDRIKIMKITQSLKLKVIMANTCTH